MKLYATTTSERASKGQGGNDKLEIHLTIQHGKENKTLADITVLPSGTIVIDETELCEIVIMKGNKQKGELVACENHSHYEQNCPECGQLN